MAKVVIDTNIIFSALMRDDSLMLKVLLENNTCGFQKLWQSATISPKYAIVRHASSNYKQNHSYYPVELKLVPAMV